MKFKDMPYERPDFEAAKQTLIELTRRLKEAASYEEAKAVFLESEEGAKHLHTMATLVSIRNSIDTRDEFYDAEQKNRHHNAQRFRSQQRRIPIRRDRTRDRG